MPTATIDPQDLDLRSHERAHGAHCKHRKQGLHKGTADWQGVNAPHRARPEMEAHLVKSSSTAIKEEELRHDLHVQALFHETCHDQMVKGQCERQRVVSEM